MILKIKIHYRILAIITMASIFLQIIFENIPFPFSSPHFYALLWIFMCLFFCKKALFNKEMFVVYLLFTILSLGILSIWKYIILGSGEKINFIWVLNQVIPIFLSILIYKYFMISKDYRGLTFVLIFTLFFIIITSLTSIIGIYIYPMAARDGSSYRIFLISPGLRNYYRSIGIGDYNFFTPLSLIFPVMIYSFKKKWNKNSFRIKVLLGLMVLLFMYAIVQAKFTMALLVSFILLIVSINLSRMQNYRLSGALLFILPLFLLLLSLTPITYFTDALFNFSGLFKDTILEERIIDLALTLKNPVIDYQENASHAGQRLGRIPLLWNSFLKNPIFGTGFLTSHAFWFDRLSMLGLVGIMPWVLIFINQIKYTLKNLNQDIKPYYVLSIFTFIMIGMVNHVVSFQIFAVIFFLVPSFAHIYRSEISLGGHRT